MKVRLNFEDAYLESLAYREDSPEDYQLLSDHLDENSRSIVEHFDDDSLINAHAQAWENEEDFKPEQPNAIDMFDNAIWDMPYLDSERALQFAEKIFDLVKYRDEKDLSVPNAIAGTIAIGSMRRLTRVLGDRTIPIWKLGYISNEAGWLDVALGEDIVDNPDIELSQKFLDEVVFPASLKTGSIFLWEYANRDAWLAQMKRKTLNDEDATEREGSTCRISDQTQAELDTIFSYVVNAEPMPTERLLELSRNNGSGLRRILSLLVTTIPFQEALTTQGNKDIREVRGRYFKLERLRDNLASKEGV